MVKRISVFGATGSIGQSTLDLVRRDPAAYEVVALTGGGNIAQLAADAREFRPQLVVTAFPERLNDLRDAVGGVCAVAAGPDAIVQAADRPADWVMSAIVGFAGLAPGMQALRHGGTLALANKESLVCAGPLLMAQARRHGATILPVDSEHSALFQALRGEDPDTVTQVTITASGGAFRDWPVDRLVTATPEQAASHPNWDMGQRITIDSASMFNKAMELIETQAYFGFAPDQIATVIHPESLIHAVVAFRDGGMIAHMGAPDMRHAIGYALNETKRADLPVAPLDLAQLGQLTFRPADPARWPALRLAQEVMRIGGLAGAVFNAAKEAALDEFIAKRVRFTDMAVIVEQVLTQMSVEFGLGTAQITLDTVAQMDHLARIRAKEIREAQIKTT